MRSLDYNITEPIKPSKVLRDFCKRNNVSQEALCAAMCVSRRTVSQVINDKRRLSPFIAVRLSYITGTTAEFWLELQTQWDIWNERRSLRMSGARLTKLAFAEQPIVEEKV